MARNLKLGILISVFDNTQKALKSIQAAFLKLSKSFFSFKTALVAAAGAAGLGLLINNSLKATDTLAKTAGKIGTTTEALSALQYAGQITGVEIATMNMALQRFTRRASEAAVGTGEAKGALRELRLDARELIRLPLDEQMLRLADAFEDAERRGLNPLRLAFKLFDSEGAQLVTTLAQGRAGLSQLFGEARRLGVVMSSNAAAGVEDANDALLRLQSLFGGVVRQTVAALAPAITALADIMTDKVASAFDGTNDGVQAFAKTLAISVVNGIIGAVKGFETLTNGLINTANELIRTKDALTAMFGGDASAEQLANAITEVEDRLNSLREQREGMVGPGAQFFDADIANLELQLAKLQKLKEDAEKSGRIQIIDPVDFQAQIDALRSAIPAIEAIKTTTKSLTDQTGKQLPSAFDAFVERLKQSRSQAEDLQTGLVNLANQGIDGLGQSFADAITGAKNFEAAVKSMVKNVVDSLIRLLIQKYIVDAAFGAITSGISGMTKQDGVYQAYNQAVPLPSGKRAMGGAVAGGRPYLVGEKGPEIMVPGTNGRVIPNNQMGGGGVTVVQNINVTTGVQQTVRAEIANLLPQISNAAKAAVADARMRGGGFSKAMVGA